MVPPAEAREGTNQKRRRTDDTTPPLSKIPFCRGSALPAPAKNNEKIRDFPFYSPPTDSFPKFAKEEGLVFERKVGGQKSKKVSANK